MKVLSFTGLFPNAIQRNHGGFVRERLNRLRERMGFDHAVVAPVPWFPRIPGFKNWSLLARVPRRERVGDCELRHPRYLKIPRLGLDRQARAMARGAARDFRALAPVPGEGLVDAHYLYPDAVAAGRLARSAGLPLVVSARGSDVNVLCRYPGPRRQIRELLVQAQAVCAVSRELCDRLRELEPACTDRLHHVPNGVDLELFHPGARAEARSALGLEQSARVLLYVGRLVRTKGLFELLEACTTLPAEVQLVAIGQGPERGALEGRAQALGLGGRARFVGEIDHCELPAWYRAADRFVLPSYSEGHPNVVCEALASGLPVVATAVGAIPDVVDGSTGALVELGVPPGDGLGERLGAALRESLETTYPEEAFAAARETLGWERTLALLSKIFEEALRR